MYLTRVEIQNIRAISHLVWEIAPENAAGWHVILGDNGAGKSTFVRGAVLGVIGRMAAGRINHYIANWLNDTTSSTGFSSLSEFTKQTVLAAGLPAGITSLSETFPEDRNFGDVNCKLVFDATYDPYDIEKVAHGQTSVIISRQVVGRFRKPSLSDVWGGASDFLPDDDEGSKVAENNSAFIASFGPFRRFSGGDVEDEDLFESNDILRRHRTTFSERLALPDALKWLQETQFKALEEDADEIPEPDAKAKTLIRNIKAFVNQPDFLPHNTRLEKVNSSGVHFVDGNGASVAAEELSDGYRSVLSLTFELLRLLSLTDGPDIFETGENGAITVAPPGVVLIDEVDAHLHPTWQKRIGFWLRKHFPKMQWIVTTHSPLICQASEKGTIYKLPTPGTEETGRMLEGAEYDRLVYGDIQDAYSTEAFGAGITRSETSQKMLDRLSELNVKEIIEGLIPEENALQEKLRAMLPTNAAVLPDEGLPV